MLALLTSQGCEEYSPKSLAIDLLLKTFNCFLEYLRGWPDDQQGLKHEVCHQTNELHLPKNHRINCVDFNFILRLVMMPKLRPEVIGIISQTVM